jgi:DNA uptake protein ComE-like DNA-binding protein
MEELTRLQDMPPETAAAIQDWRDRDNSAQPGGAERDYYATLKPPYIPRNGEIQTIREMLLIRGVTPSLLLGEDFNQNGLLDPEENDGNETSPPDNHNNSLEAGWSGIFCVNSVTANKTAAGQARINIQSASETDLATIPGITADIAKAIVEFRGQNKFENIADLMEVARLAPQNATPRNANPNRQPNQPAPPAQPSQPREQQPQRAAVGPKLISEEMFSEIADDITIDNASTQKGLVNINTASLAVLSCFNGLDEQLAQNIINHRSSAGYFANIAGVLKAQGITREIFKQIAPRITARSETFRIVSEGRVASTGARERIEVVVHVFGNYVDTLHYRENL